MLGGQADLGEAGEHHASPLPSRHAPQAQGLRRVVADAQVRGERVERVLENHLDPVAEGPKVSPAEPRDVPALEADASVRRIRQPHRHARKRRLARAGLADDAERLARREREVDAVDCLEPAPAPKEAAPERKVDADVGERQQGRAVAAGAARPDPLEGGPERRLAGVVAGDQAVGLRELGAA